MAISKNTERTEKLLLRELTGEKKKKYVALLFKRTRHAGHKLVLVGRDLSSKLPGRTKLIINVYDDQDIPLTFEDFVRQIAEWVIKREIEKESGLWRKTHEDKVTKYASHSVTLKRAIKLGIASSTNPYTEEAEDVFKNMMANDSCELSQDSQNNPLHRVCQIRHRHWSEIRDEANKMIELCNLVEKLERLKGIQQNYKREYADLSEKMQGSRGKAVELDPEYQKDFNRTLNELKEANEKVNKTLSQIFAIKNTCFQGVDDEHIGLNEVLKIQGGGIRKTRRRKRTRRKRTRRKRTRKRSTRRRKHSFRKRSTRRSTKKHRSRKRSRKRSTKKHKSRKRIYVRH